MPERHHPVPAGRRHLPVFPMLDPVDGEDLGDLYARLDLLHLVRTGVLGPAAWAWPLARVRAELDRLGRSGCYETWLRTTGTVYTCPWWCEVGHPSTGIYHDGFASPVHAGFRRDVGSFVVQLTACGDDTPTVGVHGRDIEELAVEQALELSAALATAAVAAAQVTR